MKNNHILFFTIVIVWLLFIPAYNIGINVTYNGWAQNAMIFAMLFYFRHGLFRFFTGQYKSFNIALVCYCIVCILSILLNADSISKYDTDLLSADGTIQSFEGVTSPKRAMYMCASLLALTLFVEQLSILNKFAVFLRYLFYIFGIFLIYVDLDAFSHTVIGEAIGGYVVGTKFQVCYYNLFFCILYYLRHPTLEKKIEKLLLACFLIIMFLAAIHTKCSTMVMGALVCFYLIFILSKNRRRIITSGLFLVLLTIVIDLGMFFFTTWFLSFEIVQDFIVNVLHEDLTLTGRLGIFERIMEAFNSNLWVGYGYGNSALLSVYLQCGANPQNGLIEVFLNIGILGCLAFLSLLYFGMKHIDLRRWNMKYPIVVFLFTMILISSIEVPFDEIFIFFVILLLANKEDFEININNRIIKAI